MSIMTPVLFVENKNNLKVTHFAPMTHFAPGDPTQNVIEKLFPGPFLKNQN